MTHNEQSDTVTFHIGYIDPSWDYDEKIELSEALVNRGVSMSLGHGMAVFTSNGEDDELTFLIQEWADENLPLDQEANGITAHVLPPPSGTKLFVNLLYEHTGEMATGIVDRRQFAVLSEILDDDQAFTALYDRTQGAFLELYDVGRDLVIKDILISQVFWGGPDQDRRDDPVLEKFMASRSESPGLES